MSDDIIEHPTRLRTLSKLRDASTKAERLGLLSDLLSHFADDDELLASAMAIMHRDEAVEPAQSADDERLMALGQWVDGVVMRADLAMARMSDPDEDDDTAPFTLKHALSAIDRLLPIDIDERKAHPLASRVTVWRKAWDHWQAQQPVTAEPDKPAE